MDPLMAAVNFGKLDECRKLVEAQPEVVLQAQYGGGPGSLLHEAASAGHAAVAELLLQAGALPSALDEDGQTALHHAAHEGHVDVVKLLAPSPECPELFVLDQYQMTPYHLACENGRDACVEHLLSLLEQQPPPLEGRASQLRRGSALFLAEKGGHTGVVEIINSSRSSVADEGGASARASAAAPQP